MAGDYLIVQQRGRGRNDALILPKPPEPVVVLGYHP
jgi:hypothetical protein